MNNFYFDHGPTLLDVVTIDLVDVQGTALAGDSARGWLVTRIYTSPGIRGQGRASRLLARLCADADAEGLTLFLEINPYGGLSRRQLEEWYTRKGFRWNGSFWRRRPHKKEDR